MPRSIITCACGATDLIDGRTKSAARARVSHLEARGWRCRWCETAQLAANAEAAGLPALTGSDKQVAWALHVRADRLLEVDEVQQRLADEPASPGWQSSDLNALVQRYGHALVASTIVSLREETDAHAWIEWQNLSVVAIVERDLRDLSGGTVNREALAREALIEATVIPARHVAVGTIKITASGSSITARHDARMPRLKETMESLGLRWMRGFWERTFSHGTMASVPDRLAEIGCHLLAAGYAVTILDPEARRMARTGTYTPQPVRWIVLSKDEHGKPCFRALWPRDFDCFAAARAVSTARYSEGRMLFSGSAWEEVEDFAARLDFSMTDGARALCRTWEVARDRMLIEPAGPALRFVPSTKRMGRNDSPPVLAVPDKAEVDEALLDHD